MGHVRVVSIALALTLGACALGPHPPPAPPRHTTMGITIRDFALANGLRVVLVNDPHAAEVQVTMRYAVGAADDPAESPGLAHFVEHVMFLQMLGTQSMTAHLQESTTFYNAFTTWDATTYIARARPAHLDRLLSIEAVRMGFRCVTITDAVIARERAVVVNEVKLRDEYSEAIAAIHRGIYPEGHPYRRTIGGNVESVSAMTRDQACAFADAHYAPRNAVLVISGNVGEQQVIASLGKFLARVATRNVTAPVAVPRFAFRGRRVEVPSPLDQDALVISWPLPEDPGLRAQVEAVTPALVTLVDRSIKGTVFPMPLGDTRSAMLSLVVVPATDETLADALAGAQRGIESLPDAFRKTGFEALDELGFDSVQQNAIYALYSSLEDGGDRDTRIAAYVLAGSNPSDAIAAQFEGLRSLRADDALALAGKQLALERATIVTLKASGGKKRGTKLTPTAAIHDMGQRRQIIDPAEAHQFAPGDLVPSDSEMQTRVLPNGLKVVLLPGTSVPTVEMRLIFAAGSADEPVSKRGTALAAAYALSFNVRYLNDMLRFVAAGGTQQVAVDSDHTTFSARGVDMHLDLLLAGLRRWVREGVYNFNAEAMAKYVRSERKHADDDDAITDATRTALFGALHPYARSGLVRYASEELSVEDAAEFRASRYTPDNATLLITGHFDPVLADRWIDYLFADWQGQAQPRESPHIAPAPASIVKVDDLSQVNLQIVLPAAGDSRAHRLVAASMLDELASNVRYELGASYTFGAQLAESRLASVYRIGGWIDTTRVSEAVQLLRDRIDQLKASPDIAARAFVLARKRVLTQLSSSARSAALLGAHIEREVSLGYQPRSDAAVASAVQVLTIDSMDATLAELDLTRAVVSMRGPATETQRAFEVLGRKAMPVHIDKAALDALDEVPRARRSSDSSSGSDTGDFVDAITTQPSPLDFMFAIVPGYTFASLGEFDTTVTASSTSGFSIAGEVGYHVTTSTLAGLHVGIGALSGTYVADLTTYVEKLGHLSLDIEGIAQVVSHDRLWGALLLGLHMDRITETLPTWFAGIGYGFEAGVDVVHRGRHRLAITGRLQGVFISESGYGALTLGVAYRQ